MQAKRNGREWPIGVVQVKALGILEMGSTVYNRRRRRSLCSKTRIKERRERESSRNFIYFAH